MCGRAWPSEAARSGRDPWGPGLRDIRTDRDEPKESVPTGAALVFLVQARVGAMREAITVGVLGS